MQARGNSSAWEEEEVVRLKGAQVLRGDEMVIISGVIFEGFAFFEQVL